jgi:N-acetylglucosaminylphosphatidylinositol deacetylase
MSTTTITLILAPVLFFALWHLTATLTPQVPATLRNKRIILLIAHPDDESMFFSPTLQALTDPTLQNHVKILCLSTGNADGLGDTRRKELEAAAVTLGLRRREDVFVLDDEKRFKDGMKEKWSEHDIARVLASAFAPQLNAPPPAASKTEKKSTSSTKASTKSTKKPSSASSKTSTPSPRSATPTPLPDGPRATIDVLLTFDSHGISSHPNHIALYHGARTFLSNLMREHAGYACPVSLYTLTSIGVLRKYSFIFDAVPTLISGVLGGGNGRGKGSNVMVMSDLAKYWRARSAMVSGHKSQMVWFRWGWIGVGRYMVVNDLRKEAVT